MIVFCQTRPVNWLGRRLALLGRKILLKRLPVPVEATVSGISLRLFLLDNICERRFLFMPQFFDVEEFDLIARHLPDDGVFLDVGANVGIYSLKAAQSLGIKGKIIAIEPNPVTFERLVENFGLNDIEADFCLERLGISSADGTLDLVLHPDNLGQASANPDFEGDSISVPSIGLADLLADQDVDKIDILKIDIEGFEDQALIPFFEKIDVGMRPRFLIIEKSDKQWKSDLRAMLIKCGYGLLTMTKNNYVFALA